MGEAGSGKSLVLGVFADQRRSFGLPVVSTSLLGMDRLELLYTVSTELGSRPKHPVGLPSLWRGVADCLLANRYQGLETVLLLDDADQAGRDVLAQVTRLANHDLSPESRLTLVLAGRRERMGRLGPALLELAELRIDLEPWEPSDTEHYLKSSLRQAGRTATVFDDAAVARLHELARGVPRHVARLADLALVAGAGRKLGAIDADTVESVCHELGVTGAQG
jgi:general secretion pathway protein A